MKISDERAQKIRNRFEKVIGLGRAPANAGIINDLLDDREELLRELKYANDYAEALFKSDAEHIEKLERALRDGQNWRSTVGGYAAGTKKVSNLKPPSHGPGQGTPLNAPKPTMVDGPPPPPRG